MSYIAYTFKGAPAGGSNVPSLYDDQNLGLQLNPGSVGGGITTLSNIWYQQGTSCVVFYGEPQNQSFAGFLQTQASSYLDLGTGDFTFEVSFRPTALSGYGKNILASLSNGSNFNFPTLEIGLDANGMPYASGGAVDANTTTAGFTITGSSAVSLNHGHILSLVRQSGTFTLYLDGQQVGTAAVSVALSTGNKLTIGCTFATHGFNFYTGDIDQVIVNKSAMHTGNYTVTLSDGQGSTTTTGGTVSSSTSLSDPYAANVTMLASLVGAHNGDTTFTDSFGNTITCEGTVAVSTTTTHFGQPTIALSGQPGGRVLISPTSALNMSATSDSTVEGWIYPTAIPNSYIGGSASSLFSSATSTGGMAGFFVCATSTGQIGLYFREYWCIPLGAAGVINLNQWNHIAVSFHGNTAYLAVNGVLQGTGTISDLSALTNTDFAAIVGSVYSDATPSGYLGQFRVTKGVARYTSNYTVPSTAWGVSTMSIDPYAGQVTLNFLPEGFAGEKTWTDAHGNVFTLDTNANFTSGTKLSGLPSVSVTHASSTISISPSSALDLTNDKSTLEFWFKPTASTGNLFSTGDTGGPMSGFFMNLNTSGQIGLYVREYYLISPITAQTVTFGQWNHVAVVTDGLVVSIYINGLLGGTGTFGSQGAKAQGFGVTNKAFINNSVYGDGGADGYFGQIRVTKDVARYNGTFIPEKWFDVPVTADPLAPLVSLYLTGQDLKDHSVQQLTPSVVTGSGSVVITSNQSEFNLSSIAFGGTGARLNVPYAPALNLSSGDWTIEADVYLNAFPGCIVSKDQHYGSTYVSYKLGVGGDGKVQATIGTGTDSSYAQDLYSNQVLSLNTWHTLALVRSGNTLSMYIDGQLDTSLTITGTMTDSGADLWVGNMDIGSTPFGLNGNIQQLRITKGVARYTSNYRTTGLIYSPSATINAADPDWNNTSLYLDFEGGDGSNLISLVSNSIIDKSIFGNPVATVKDSTTTDIPTIVANGYQNGNSLALNGSWLSIPHADNLSLAAVAQFTIEAMINIGAYPTDTSATILTKDDLYGVHQTAYRLAITQAGYLQGVMGDATGSGDYFPITSTQQIPLNQWVHVAMVRNGTDLSIYINGAGTHANNVTFAIVDIGTPLLIGSTPKGTGDGINALRFHGQLDIVRITKGVARYLSDFTTTTSLVSLQLRAGDSSTASSLVDSGSYGMDWNYCRYGVTVSSDQSMVGGKSFYFSGASGNRIALPNQRPFGLGTGDFTLETWVNIPTLTASGALFDFRTDGSYESRIGLFIDGTARTLWLLSSGTRYGDGTITIPTDTWIHVALTRKSGVTTCWIGGQNAWSTSVAFDGGVTSALGIGCCFNPAYGDIPFKGYMDQIRLVRGKVLYSAAFTPSQVPLGTPVGIASLTSTDKDTYLRNVALLLHGQGYQTSTVIRDNSQNGLLPTTVQGVYHDEANPLFGISSLYYTGSNSVIGYPELAQFGLGLADFTIEGWFKPSVVSGDQGLFDFRLVDGLDRATFFIHNGQLSIWGGGGSGTASGNTGAMIQANVWQHIAFTRQNGTISAWLNGQLQFSTTNVYDLGSTAPLGVGGSVASGLVGTSPFTGNIAEIRVTRNTARYNATFTPASTSFQSYSKPVYPFPSALNDSHAANVRVWMQDSVTNLGSSTLAVQGDYTNQSNLNALFGNSVISMSGSVTPYYFSPNPDLYLTTSDYTMEAWVFLMDSNAYGIFSCRYNVADGWALQSNGFRASINGTWSDSQITFPTPIKPQVWTHIALTKTGSTIEVFLNGVSQGQVTGVTSVSDTVGNFSIGSSAYNTGENALKGYVQGIRFTQGVDRYTGITKPLVPTKAFDANDQYWNQTTVLLHFDQGSINNAGNYVSTNTATPDDSQYHHRVWAPFNAPALNQTPAVFGGSVDLVSSSYNNRLDLSIGGYPAGPNGSTLVDTDGGQAPYGNEDFTIEAFFRPVNYPVGGAVALMLHWWDGSHGINVELRPDGTVGIWIAGPGTYTVSSASMPLNQWTFVTLTRQSDVVYLYFDGVLVSTNALPAGYSLPHAVLMLGGDQTTDNREYSGYIDEFRLTKGVARISTTSKFVVNAGASEYPDYVPPPSNNQTATLTTTSTGTIHSSDTVHLVYTATGLTEAGSYYVSITANGQSNSQSFTPDGNGNATVQIDVIPNSVGADAFSTSITFTVQAMMGGNAKGPQATYTLALTPTVNATLTTTAVSPLAVDSVSFSYHIDQVPESSSAFDLVVYQNGVQGHVTGLGGTAGQPLDASFNFTPSSVGVKDNATSVVVTAQLYLANYGFIGPVVSYTLGLTSVPLAGTVTLTSGNSAPNYQDTVTFHYHAGPLPADAVYAVDVSYNGVLQSSSTGLPLTGGNYYDRDYTFTPASMGATASDTTMAIRVWMLQGGDATNLAVATYNLALTVGNNGSPPSGSLSIASSTVVSNSTVDMTVSVTGLTASTQYSFFVTNHASANTTFTTDGNGSGTGTVTIDPTALSLAAGAYSLTGFLRKTSDSSDPGITFNTVSLTVTAATAGIPAVGSLALGKTTMAVNETVSTRLNFTGFTPNRDYNLLFFTGSVKGTELSFMFTTDANGAFNDIGTGYTTYGFSPTDSQISVGNNQALLMSIQISDQSSPAVTFNPGITINVTAADYGETGKSNDPYAANVVLLLDLSTDKHSIIDRSPVGWTMNQVPVYSHESQLGATGTFIWLGPNGKGLKVGGTTNDFLTYEQDPQKLANFDLSSGDWTIEAITSYSYWSGISSITAKTSGGTGLNFGALETTSSNIGVYTYIDGAKVKLAEPAVDIGPVASVENQHIAAVCRNGVITVYIAGEVYATGPAQATPFGSPSFDNFLTAANCTIYGLRITKGVARYNGTFVPPTGFSGSTMGNADGFSGIVSDTLSNVYDPFYDRVTLNVSMLRTTINSISGVSDYGPSANPISTIGTVTFETVTQFPYTLRYLRLNGSGAIKFSGLGSGIRFNKDDWTIELSYIWMGGNMDFKLLDLGPSLVVMVQGGVYQVETQTNPGGVDPDSFTYTDPYFNMSDLKNISISRVGKMLFFHSNGIKVAEKTMVANNDFPYYTDTLYIGGDAQSVTNGSGGNIRFNQIRVTRGVGRYVGDYDLQFPYSANSYYDTELLDRLTGTAGNPLTGHVADIGGAAWGDTSGFNGIPSQITNMTFVNDGVNPGKGVR